MKLKTKLQDARSTDHRFQVFGAKSHQYQVRRPLTERSVCAFETRNSLVLPDCYRAFLTRFGNGGDSFRGSAAGPFYGIYPLGEMVDEILAEPAMFLNQPARIVPDMSDQDWAVLTRRMTEDDSIADEDYEAERGKIYTGLLPIGSQGCTYIHALVISGPHRGRVVNLNLDGQKPKFAFESNFLDWYERWLDEVISGDLTDGGPTWFGYTMGGDDIHLMGVFAAADRLETKLAAVQGLAKLKTATEASCRKLLALCDEEDEALRHHALRMLTKFAYSMACEPLRAHIAGTDDDCLAACQSIHWYAAPRSNQWVDQLRSRLPSVNTPETFQFLSYLLRASGVDFSLDFRPFCARERDEIRVTAYYSLGTLANKHQLVDCFIPGLDDRSPRVVHAALQALRGVADGRLLAPCPHLGPIPD